MIKGVIFQLLTILIWRLGGGKLLMMCQRIRTKSQHVLLLIYLTRSSYPLSSTFIHLQTCLWPPLIHSLYLWTPSPFLLNMWDPKFCLLFISLSIMLIRFIHVVTKHKIWQLNNRTVYACMYITFFYPFTTQWIKSSKLIKPLRKSGSIHQFLYQILFK